MEYYLTMQQYLYFHLSNGVAYFVRLILLVSKIIMKTSAIIGQHDGDSNDLKNKKCWKRSMLDKNQ